MALENNISPKSENNSELENILPEESQESKFTSRDCLEAGISGALTGIALYGIYFAGFWYFSR